MDLQELRALMGIHFKGVAGEREIAVEQVMREIMEGRAIFTPSADAHKMLPCNLMIAGQDVAVQLAVGLHLIGRVPQGPLVTIGDIFASKLHCLIDARADGIITVQDIGSANNTVLSNIQLDPYKVYECKPDDVIQVGVTSIVFSPQV